MDIGKLNNIKLDLGCGKFKKKGFFGIDKFPSPNVDRVVDVDEGLPFSDNSVIEIYSSHVLEHVDSLEEVMEEIYRVCKPGAKVLIKVPHFSGKSGFFEFHKRFFRYDSFSEFEKKELDMDISTNPMKFKVVRRKLCFLKKKSHPFAKLLERFFNMSSRLCNYYEETFLRNLFPAHEVEFELRPIKH